MNNAPSIWTVAITSFVGVIMVALIVSGIKKNIINNPIPMIVTTSVKTNMPPVDTIINSNVFTIESSQYSRYPYLELFVIRHRETNQKFVIAHSNNGTAMYSLKDKEEVELNK